MVAAADPVQALDQHHRRVEGVARHDPLVLIEQPARAIEDLHRRPNYAYWQKGKFVSRYRWAKKPRTPKGVDAYFAKRQQMAALPKRPQGMLESGIILRHMPNTGGRWDLGPYPAWVAGYLLAENKSYEGELELGVNTDTYDSDGQVTECRRDAAAAVTEGELRRAMAGFLGTSDQIPPMFSAIKQGGKPLHKLARAGKTVTRAARSITITSFELVEFANPKVDFSVSCSKGTYVRSLAEDIGRVLACGAHVGVLRRVQSGPFGEQDCLPLDQLDAFAEENDFDALDQLLLPVDSALVEMPEVRVSEDTAFYLRQGQAVLVPNAPLDGYVKLALKTGGFFGVGETTDDGRLAPSRLLVSN